MMNPFGHMFTSLQLFLVSIKSIFHRFLVNTSAEEAPPWEELQQKLMHIPGCEGQRLRSEEYPKYFGRFGSDVIIEVGCYFTQPSFISIDDNVRINRETIIYGSGGLRIGANTLIGPRCFIHTADHDIDHPSLTFAQSGYIYKPTKIGANCLISANVSLLGGVDLACNTFVGCGAVVKQGEYCDNAKLVGVPAVDKRERAIGLDEENLLADIVILVHPLSGWAPCVENILTCLGMPQVQKAFDLSKIANTFHAVILVGPIDWKPDLPEDVSCFRFVDADLPLNSTELTALGLDEMLEISHAPTIDENTLDVEHKLDVCLFWLLERLIKGSAPLSVQECTEWKLFLAIFSDGNPDHALINTISENIHRRNSLEIFELSSDITAYLNNTGNSQTTKSLLAKIIQSILLDEKKAVRSLESEFFQSNIWNLSAVFPQVKVDAKNLLYSPLCALYYYLKFKQCATKVDPKVSIGRPICDKTSLNWKVFAENRKFFSIDKKLVSSSLLEVWQKYNSVKVPDGRQVYLTEQSYHQTFMSLLDLWSELICEIQYMAGNNVVQLHPWPSSYTNALSLRYDVDRPISASRITEICSMQTEICNSQLGSWYFFSGEPKQADQVRLLQQYNQEIGLHSISLEREQCESVGVTHHSSPIASYWRADKTIEFLCISKASYGENLSVNCIMPSPYLIVDKSMDINSSKTWKTPLHFPLEGSTNDTDLGYFDKLKSVYEKVIASGGHVIIGTHPDLNQEIMVEALNRLDLRNFWCAPVDEVVTRIKTVMTTGNISCASRGDFLELSSILSINDLSLELKSTSKDSKNNIQLVAGRKYCFRGEV